MNRLLLSVLVMMAICVSVSVSLKCYEGINTFKEVDCPADAVVCATFTGKRNGLYAYKTVADFCFCNFFAGLILARVT